MTEDEGFAVKRVANILLSEAANSGLRIRTLLNELRTDVRISSEELVHLNEVFWQFDEALAEIRGAARRVRREAEEFDKTT